MKRGTLLIVIWLSILPLYGVDSDFNRANELYETGKYEEALKLYSSIEKAGEGWKLYYNMGNSFFKSKDYLNAKIYYLKAERLNPSNQDIKVNINITNRYFKDKIPEEEVDFIASVVLKINSMINLDLVSYLLIVSIFLLNSVVILGIYKKINRRFFFYLGTFFFTFTIFMVTYHFYRVNLETTSSVAVVLKDGVSLFSGPGVENTAIFEINRGLKLTINGQSHDWFQVSASKDIAGWIRSDHIEKI